MVWLGGENAAAELASAMGAVLHRQREQAPALQTLARDFMGRSGSRVCSQRRPDSITDSIWWTNPGERVGVGFVGWHLVSGVEAKGGQPDTEAMLWASEIETT